MPTAVVAATQRSPMARQVMIDVCEMLGHQILTDPVDRLERWKAFEHFSKELGNVQHGRINSRNRLAKTLLVACLQDPYTKGEGPGGRPLANWSRKDWETLQYGLEKCRDVLLRKDAGWLHGESEQVHAGRQANTLYHHKLDKIVRLIHIHQTLSKFRWDLEEQIRLQKEGRPRVRTSDVAEFAELIENDFQDEPRVQKALEAMLNRSESSRSTTRCSGVSLISLEELAKLMKVKPFSFYYFQDRLELLLHKWAEDVFGSQEPTLVKLGYRIQPAKLENEADVDSDEEEAQANEEEQGEEADDDVPMDIPLYTQQPETITEDHDSQDENKTPGAEFKRRSSPTRKRKASDNDDGRPPLELHPDVENLKTARTNLHNDVDDPLEESRKLAANAVAQQAPSPAKKRAKGTLYAKKASATQMTFEDSEDEEVSGVKLSAVPDRPKIKTPQKQEVRPDPVVVKADGTRRRMKFTLEEKTAIKEGLKKHGTGKWADIKADYAIVLRNRTSVNIKDCYRTMLKHGEVEPPSP